MWKYPMMVVLLTLSGKCGGEVHNALLAIQKLPVIGPCIQKSAVEKFIMRC